MTDFSSSQRLFRSHDTICPLVLRCVRVMSVCKNGVFPTGVPMQAIRTAAEETINGAIEGWRPHDQKDLALYCEVQSEVGNAFMSKMWSRRGDSCCKIQWLLKKSICVKTAQKWGIENVSENYERRL
jgi:hypothetical protein